MDQLKPPYTLILDELRKGKVIPFLGAGASLGNRAPNSTWEKGKSPHLPKGSELAEHLAKKTAFPRDANQSRSQPFPSTLISSADA